MPKVIQYKILKAHHSAELLQEDVQKHIDKGWQPYSGFYVRRSPSGDVFYQPVIKTESLSDVQDFGLIDESLNNQLTTPEVPNT